MATSPLFGWEEPDDVDLVKDGAAAIRTLGNAIDTSMGDLLGGTSGQVLSKNSNTNMDFTWVTPDDANAIQNSIVNAKGDLIAASANDVPAIISAGANGETLVADSSTSTGLRYQGNFAAGKNAVINGDFNIWQRGTTFTNPSAGTFTCDRYSWDSVSMTGSITRQAFTPGTAPVAGYEGTYFARLDITSGTQYGELVQKIENGRTNAGQTVTASFWAKLNSGASGWQVNVVQNFGTGGSPSSAVLAGQTSFTPTASWQRFTFTVAVPSVAGKTFGTNNNSYLAMTIQKTSTTASQLDTWGWQLEVGNTATAFQTATGTIQGELGACMRYAEKVQYQGGSVMTVGQAYSTSAAWSGIAWTTQKRATPTITQTGTVQALQANTGTSGTTFAYGQIGINNARMEHSGGSGLVAGNACIYQATGSTVDLLITSEL